MFDSEILDVVIGLVFIFLLLSLLCSAVKEMFEAWMKKRATDLEKGIRILLNDPDGKTLASELYNHHLVYGLFQGEYEPDKIKKGNYPRRSNLPSYIPTRTFALALMDVVLTPKSTVPADAGKNTGNSVAPAADNTTKAADASTSTPNPLQPFLDAISRLDNRIESEKKVKQALTSLINTAGNDIGKFRENIEAWYDSAMERVSGWYKRHSQKMLLLFAFIITVGMNVNTIDIANHLFRDKALRDSLVAQAEAVAKEPNLPENRVSKIEAKIQNIGLPIGWSQVKWDCSKCSESTSYLVWDCILLRFFGWGITIFAISLGAPFWFDLLNKFMKIRSTIKPSKGGANKPAAS